MAAPPRSTDAELEYLLCSGAAGRPPYEMYTKPSPRKPTQYTTVLKTLQIMAGKGLVQRDEQLRAHVYEAALPCEVTQRQLAGDLLARAFNGSARGLMLGALSTKKASNKELAELRKLLDDYERGNL